MAEPTGRSSFNLTEQLLKKGHEYNFFQAMRLARLLGYLPAATEESSESAKGKQPLRIRPMNSLSFPAADIARIEKTSIADEAPGLSITATFLGLYGPASPLPSFYTEDLMQDEAQDEVVGREFLDIFNHRLFTLFFRCCTKYRLFFQVVEEKNTSVIDRLFCLTGLGETMHRKGLPDSYALLRYSGLLNQHPHSALGLATLLSDALDGIPVNVLQCCKRLVKIPGGQRMQLGQTSCALGMDSTLGEEIEDYTGKFRLSVGPVTLVQFTELLPERSLNKKAAMLTKLYLQDPLEYDMELILKEGEAATACLGAASMSSLGWDTWVFSSKTIGEVEAIFPLQ